MASSNAFNSKAKMSKESLVTSTLDFTRLLEDEIFTFVVGATRRKIRVHISAVKRISEPLTFMMVNGKMKESIEQEAFLDDVEPQAFTRLVKFAYLGICGVVDMASIESSATSAVSSGPPGSWVQGYRCFVDAVEMHILPGRGAPQYPYCSAHCKSRASSLPRSTQVFCIVLGCRQSWVWNGTNYGVLCSNHSSTHRASHASPANPWSGFSGALPPTSGVPPSSSQAFTSRQYSCESFSHTALSSYIDSHQSTNTNAASCSLLEVVQLYCLADRYLVPELPKICLHILHRKLTELTITDDLVGVLTDMLLYIYAHTKDDGDILDESCDAMRTLVMSYITVHSARLLRHKEFREILSVGGYQTADFMALMFAQKTDLS